MGGGRPEMKDSEMDMVHDDEEAYRRKTEEMVNLQPQLSEASVVSVVQDDVTVYSEDVGEEDDEEAVRERAKQAGVLKHPIDAYRDPCHCPDAIFGIAWGICFLTTLFVCFEYGWTQMSEAEYDDDDDENRKASGKIGAVLMCQFLVAFAVSLLVAHVTMRIGRFAVHTLMIMTELVLLGGAAFAAEFAYWYVCLVLVFLAIAMMFYQANTLHHIDNASATLEIACKYLARETRLQGIHFLGCFVATVMIFVCCFATFCLYHYKDAKNANRNALALSMLLLIIIGYWTARFLKYIVVSCVAAAFRWWWYDEKPPLAHRPPRASHPAVVAFFRTWMFNVGPVAYGSLFVDLFDMFMGQIRSIKNWADRYPDGMCATCLVKTMSCCLGGCAGGCDIVNPYAFIYVGIHGYSFTYAGKKVIDVFHKMGRKASQTEVFTDYVIFWNSIAIGLAAAVMGIYMIIHSPQNFGKGTKHAQTIVGFIGFFGGTSVASVVLGLITGANKAVALLFSDTPRILALTHPDEFATLATVWQFGPAALAGGAFADTQA